MRSLVLALHLILFSICITKVDLCQFQVVLNETYPSDNILTVELFSDLSDQDAVVWQTSPSNNIEVLSILYTDDNRDSIAISTSFVAQYRSYQLTLSYTPFQSSSDSNIDGADGNDSSVAISRSPTSLIFSFLIITSLIGALFSTNKTHFSLIVVILIGILLSSFQDSPGFGVSTSCNTKILTIVKVPSTVLRTCFNQQCIINSFAKPGVAYHPGTGPPPSQTETNLMTAVFGFARTDFFWSAIEYTAPGIYDFSTKHNLTNWDLQNNILPMFIFCYGNSFYGAVPDNETSRDAFTNYAIASLQNFSGNGIVWELYNEPNGDNFWPPVHNSTEYGLLALELGALVKENYPNETYVGPATSGVDLTFIEDIFMMGAIRYFDMITVHPYRSGSPETADTDLLNLRSLIKKYTLTGNLVPLNYPGEWGYSTQIGGGIDIITQAQYFIRQYLNDRINECPYTVWYDWHNDGTNASYSEHNYGVVYNNFTAKPAYLAGLTLNAVLENFRFNKLLATSLIPTTIGQTDYITLFDKINLNSGNSSAVPSLSLVFVCWTTTNVSHVVSIPIGEDQTFTVTDMFGNNTSISSTDGLLNVQISQSPVYVIPSNSQTDFLQILGLISRLPIDTFSIGNDVDISVSVINPTSSNLMISLEGGDTITLPPYDSGVITKSVTSLLPIEREILTLEFPSYPNLNFSLQTYLIQDTKYSYHFYSYSTNSLGWQISIGGEAATSLHLVIDVYDNTTKIGQTQSFDLNGVTSDYSLPLQVLTQATNITDPIVFNATIFDSQDTAVLYITPKILQVADSVIGTSSNYSVPINPTSNVTASINLTILYNVSSPQQFENLNVFKVDYQAEAGYKYALIMPKRVIPIYSSSINLFGQWIYGDNSSAAATIRVKDSIGTYFQPSLVEINWTGWKLVYFKIDAYTDFFPGTDPTVHYPIVWDTFMAFNFPGYAIQSTLQFTSPFSISNSF